MKSLNLAIGLYDDPDNQIQDIYSFDLYTSNLAIFGHTMSGKTTLLKTLLIRMHQKIIGDEEEIYILDFSNNLESYKSLPYVRAYFDSYNEENIRRIFKLIFDKLTYNIKELPGKNFIEKSAHSKAKHITLIIDGVHALFADDCYARYQNELKKLSTDGLSKGISIIITANEPSVGLKKLLSSYNHVIAFDLDQDQYSELFTDFTSKPVTLKGRGIALLEDHSYEFQAFLPYNSDIKNNSEEQMINQIIECLIQNGVDVKQLQSVQLKSLTGDLTEKNWKMYTQKPLHIEQHLVAGIDYYQYLPATIDLMTAKTIAIYGKRQYGKTNLLKLILKGLSLKEQMRVICFDDVRRELDQVEDDLVEFGQKIEIDSCSQLLNYLYQLDHHIEVNEIDSLVSADFVDLNRNIYDDNYFGIDGPDVLNEPVKEKSITESSFHPLMNIFIIQSRLFYSKSEHVINQLSDYIERHENTLVIFSDVQRITDLNSRQIFNNCIHHAFLLDDILKFIKSRGATSKFSEYDEYELKENFGKSSLGDGFYYNVDYDEIQKLKMVKVDDDYGRI
ncbi:FtsK/SpoIIIE domain-containing protein [uncultured Thomasclavelia sp.]|uniref:FtsK/SpoIIIE domain-containing protein n=1 Tax=uncultured Thomasclavelia sp. TaxID=3025759 RepID=UPI0025D7340F|nr:FtsK/SpoIIIE domain-containing protein [uncultured Thomasclavelia sp.]